MKYDLNRRDKLILRNKNMLNLVKSLEKFNIHPNDGMNVSNTEISYKYKPSVRDYGGNVLYALYNIEVKLPRISPNDFIKTSRRKYVGSFIRTCRRYFDDKGRWDSKFESNDVEWSDGHYAMFKNKKTAQKFVNEIHRIIREEFKITYEPTSTDCDDFMYIAKGLASILLFMLGINIGGSPIGVTKVSYYKDRSLKGHALCTACYQDSNAPQHFLYEPQNTLICSIPEYEQIYKLNDLKIHFIDF